MTLAMLLFFAAAGCTLQPKYERPAPPLPPDWTTGNPSMTQANATDRDWKEVIVDPPTRRLVELALDNNRDLRAAALRIYQLQAHYQVERANLFPKIDGFAKAEYVRTPGSLTTNKDPKTYRAYTVGVGFSNYELDFFGRLRSLKDKALEEYLSSESSHKSIELSLVASTAAQYLTVVANRERLALAEEILRTRQGDLALVQARYDIGHDNELDLARAQQSMESAQVEVAKYKAMVTGDENQLAVLVGIPLTPELMPARDLSQVLPLVPVPAGLPSNILTRRPDVLEAEHLLKAANADIGAARALHFPAITLTTSYGTSSNEINGLFKAGSWAWAFTPQISVPIFHSGAIDATVREAEAHHGIMLAKYEKAIQTAFREVSDSLANVTALNDQVQAQTSLVKSAGRVYELTNLRYEAGRDSSLSTFDAQRTYAMERQNLVFTRLLRQTNMLTLYKALGGGWAGE